ncbi:MAG: hypothetical protein VCC01_08935 [Candidatus Hydrogenedentota bacterium]
MAGAKRFLIIFAVVYIIAATGINITLGPPGMSKGYLADHKADHNQYIESIKNKQFKIWKQRPDLADFEAAENIGLQKCIDFVTEYEQRELFKDERSRRNTYDLLFDVFNTAMVLVLLIGLGRKPFSGMIDGMIDAVRTKINETEEARKRADERLDTAEHKIKGLTEDLAGYEELVEERIEIIRRDSALFTGESLAVLNDETADRKRFVEVQARQQVKERLVDAAIDQVLVNYQASTSTDRDEVLIERFLAELRENST